MLKPKLSILKVENNTLMPFPPLSTHFGGEKSTHYFIPFNFYHLLSTLPQNDQTKPSIPVLQNSASTYTTRTDGSERENREYIALVFFC